jgi:DNA anti-recombination protein RmuC
MPETATKRPGSPVLEEVFQNIRKVAEANLKMQQDLLSQCSSLWPGIPTPQSAWIHQIQQFRSKLADTVSELARKHGEAVDRRYKAATESLDAALSISDATTPEEFRRKSEQLCRKSLDCVREVAETQVREFQEAITKWTDVLAKVGA